MSRQAKSKRRVQALSAAGGAGLLITLLGSAASPELAEFLKWVLEQYGIEGFIIAGAIVAFMALMKNYDQALQGRINDLRDVVRHLEQDNESDRRLINAVNQELTAARKQIEAVEREKERQSKEYSGIRDDNKQLRIILDAQRIEIDQIKQRYEEILKAYSEMLEENKKFRNANDFLREQLEAATAANKVLREQLDVLAETKDKRIAELENKVAELQRRVEELQCELDKAKVLQSVPPSDNAEDKAA